MVTRPPPVADHQADHSEGKVPAAAKAASADAEGAAPVAAKVVRVVRVAKAVQTAAAVVARARPPEDPAREHAPSIH